MSVPECIGPVRRDVEREDPVLERRVPREQRFTGLFLVAHDEVPEARDLDLVPRCERFLHRFEDRFDQVRRFLLRKPTDLFVDSFDDLGLRHVDLVDPKITAQQISGRNIEEARALLRARLLDVLGEGASDPQCGECGESHGDLAEGAVS